MEVHFPEAQVIRLVLDNLNTHTLGCLYEVFEPSEAHRIAHKLEFYFTPKHASWLTMAELEFSVLVRQCLKQRIPSLQAIHLIIHAWQLRCNAHQATVNWRFSTADARTRLSLYSALLS